MNDRYLFKAKRINDGEWIVGDLINSTDGRIAISKISDEWEVYECEKDTLCQCTGLKDRSGTLIWENDIVEISTEDGYFSIDWDEDTARFVMNGDGLTVDFDNFWPHEVEVVGNRVDNHELMEAE